VKDRFDVTMLLVDHDMALIMRICSRIYVLDYGRIIAEGPPERIRDDPHVIRAYLGEPDADDADSTWPTRSEAAELAGEGAGR
jgi:branched-chain amino acid transport system ATP-binding protein